MEKSKLTEKQKKSNDFAAFGLYEPASVPHDRFGGVQQPTAAAENAAEDIANSPEIRA